MNNIATQRIKREFKEVIKSEEVMDLYLFKTTKQKINTKISIMQVMNCAIKLEVSIKQ